MPNPKPTFDKIRALFIEESGIDPGEPAPFWVGMKWLNIVIATAIILGIIYGL